MAVSLLLTVTAIAWTHAEIWFLLAQTIDVTCWPMLPDCRELRLLDADQLRFVIYALGVGSLVPAALFAVGRGIAVAWWALLGLNVVKHALFPLSWCLDPTAPRLISELVARRLAPASVVVAALFSFLQLLPKLFPGDSAVTGQGRLLSVHMFDAYTSCESFARIRMKNGRSLRLNLYRPMAPRIHCDPIVHLNRARNVCYKNRNNRRFEDVDLLLRSKRATDPDYRTIVDLKSVCSEPVRYRLFWTNAWISP